MLTVTCEHYSSQLQRLALAGINKYSCCQYIVQCQRIVLTSSLFHLFASWLSLENIPIRIIGIHCTSMTVHCDTMADQVTRLHVRVQFYSDLVDYLIDIYYMYMYLL